MKALALTLALLAAIALPALAERPAGIVGTIVDLDNGHVLPRAQVQIYRMPIENIAHAAATLTTNPHGFFSTIVLQPGRYLVVATARGVRSACEISNVYAGVVERIRMAISAKGERCIGRNAHSALLLPGQTADVYIVH